MQTSKDLHEKKTKADVITGEMAYTVSGLGYSVKLYTPTATSYTIAICIFRHIFSRRNISSLFAVVW